MSLPKIVIFFGLPGSGKGTQADLLAKNFGYLHFDTGKEIERTVHNPANLNDPMIKREANLFDTGFLNTPSWVEGLARKRTEEYIKDGQKLVFSGSPRTLPEAEGLFKVFDELVGRDAVLAFMISVADKTSIFRNSHRRICQDCRIPLIWNQETAHLISCLDCGGELIKRVLDEPDIIKERIKEYRKKTEPAVKYFKDKGVRFLEIDGESGHHHVSENIVSSFNLV